MLKLFDFISIDMKFYSLIISWFLSPLLFERLRENVSKAKIPSLMVFFSFKFLFFVKILLEVSRNMHKFHKRSQLLNSIFKGLREDLTSFGNLKKKSTFGWRKILNLRQRDWNCKRIKFQSPVNLN